MWKLQRVVKTVLNVRSFTTNHLKNVNNFDISEEVMFALKNKQGIVALESTIITHGMPYPNNLECALEVENIIRKQGAVPATIAIIGGKVTIGLNNQQLALLADYNLNKSIKTSRRDLPYVISQKLNGGTTVSGTIVIAEKVGIPVFVTGGIGGVHRQRENTLDISADLTELGRSFIAVVSSGVKSILDISKTLEYLETQGVFVATYGPTKDFPAFYSRTSGCKAPYNVTSALQAAEIIDASFSANMKSGMLFGVPIPEEHALEPQVIEKVIQKALKEAENKNITGKEVTPFLLEKVKTLTSGKSLEANMALIKNNAIVGAEIAVELAKIRSGENQEKQMAEDIPSPVVIGGAVVDSCAKLHKQEITKSSP